MGAIGFILSQKSIFCIMLCVLAPQNNIVFLRNLRCLSYFDEVLLHFDAIAYGEKNAQYWKCFCG